MACNEPSHTQPSKTMITVGLAVVAYALVAMVVHNQDASQNDLVFSLGLALVILMYFAPRLLSFKINRLVEAALSQLPPTQQEAASIARAESEVADGHVKGPKELKP